MTRVLISAPAKVNLRLVVLAREESGYHTLETLFCGISLADLIEIEPAASGIELEVTGGVDAGPLANNLAVRAAAAFYDRLGEPPALRIRLEKVIPAAAGLGGGSSDAAATLLALNAFHGEPLDYATLRTIGASLGSDVAFFLTATPFALAWSRGERLLELNPPAERPILLVFPGIAIPTSTAFGRLDQLRGHSSAMPEGFALSVRDLGDWASISAHARNDFEPVVREMVPRLDRLKSALIDAGGEVVLLSGSGSAVFAVFQSIETLASAEMAIGELGVECRRATTLTHWPRPTVKH